MAEHKHGEMDITVQQRTFDRFVHITGVAVICIFVFLIFLAIVNG